MEDFDDNFLKLYEEANNETLDIAPNKKQNFIGKMLSYIAKSKGHESEYVREEDYSVFEHIANNSSIHDNTKENQLAIREAVMVSEEAIKIFQQKIGFLNKSKVTSDKLNKMDVFSKLSQKDIDYLKMILSRYQAVIKERHVVDAQLQSFSKSVVHINELIDDANENLPKIEDAERSYRIFRQDINHIEGEKQELLDEMETLIIGRDFFKKFSLIFIGVSVLFTIGICFAGIFYEADIFMPIFIVIMLVMIVGTGLAVLRSNISKRMKLNIAFQKRAVELLNKKNAVYAYYINYLNFEYNKYKVNSSMELKQYIRDVGFYRQALKRSRNVRNVVRECEVEIYGFLDEHNIRNLKMSLLQFADTINIDEQKRMYENLSEEKYKIEEILTELDEKYDLLILKLEDLKDKDTTSTGTIKEIVRTFYAEIQKIVNEYSI